ncbi:hypothetical protein IGI46_002228 [Enterococcus sp. AZ163]
MLDLGIIGIVISMILIILLAIKRVSILVAAPISAFIALIFSGYDLGSSLNQLIGKDNSYMFSLSSFVADFFPIFLLGAILAKLIDKSGAAKSIANRIIKLIGTRNKLSALLAIYLISVVFTLGGISLFVIVFVITPLARPIFKHLNIPWEIVPLPIILGGATFTMTMLPGTPSIQNVIPANYLETSLTASPLIGITSSVVSIIVSILFMKYSLDRQTINNLKNIDRETNTALNLMDSSLPSFVLSISPLLFLLTIIIFGSIFKVNNILVIGLISAIILSVLLFKKRYPTCVK